MPIPILCACGVRFKVADEYAGGWTQCPECGSYIAIPVTTYAD